ncbi:MAG: glycosyltransferase [Nibricoccus sp.]
MKRTFELVFPMKILVVSPQFPSPALPMRGLTSNEQFRLLRAAGHEVQAIVPLPWAPPFIPRASWQRRRAVPKMEMDHGVPIIHPRYLSLAHFSKAPFSIELQRHLFWRALRPYTNLFSEDGGNVIHAHSSGLPGCMIGRTGGAKFVVSMLDNELFDIAPVSPSWRRAITDTLRHANSVVYLSPLLMRVGIEVAGSHNASVIPLAIDVYNDLQPRRPTAFTISTAARLIERKKIHVLIEAFVIFRREFPEAQLVVIGNGSELPRLKKLTVHHGIADATQFTGSISHREVVTRIAESHLFVLPSVRESLGTVYFEAMSQGVPVIGTKGEGIADFIVDGEEGFLVHPNDPESIVRIMRALHGSESLRNRISEGARRCFERSRVRWTDSVSAHLALFESLIQAKHGP